ncbi:SPBc2 prophage-derived glycosyltransferase SunS [Gimesia alba]|uniref:SPBc2 prophage-derived glycosyltransferase SunS n=1 Tax=Gimesia alba TaxID=2527973 RepID=A0A517R8X7_9PLAN|nr:glycosyltransferase [Gimesia alba]QDT40357.1 SPBc2 prophage-derived glycosyltransferase SunS [Gimesia alba]
MNFKRIALIFDNQARPETTGFYCRRALGDLVDVEHFLPEEIPEIPADQFDLFLNIDDGFQYHLPEHLRPAACWVIDTHMDLPWCVEKASHYDFVFAAQQDGARKLQNKGISSALWLPLACDPEIHRPYQVEKQYDFSFVGNLIGQERCDLLNTLVQKYPDHFIGQKYFEEMARIYSASRVVFNHSVKNDINMRVFEALGCGSLLLTNDLAENGQAELFSEGQHFATYTCPEEMLDKVDYYLKHESEREKLARQGHELAFSQHTYQHRMQALLTSIEDRQSKTSVSMNVQAPSPVNSSTEERGHRNHHIPLPEKSVSACLLSWKRPDNLGQIISHLRQYAFIDDILIWNNNPEIHLEIDIAGVHVIQADQNLVTYGRFLCAQQAQHPIIFTQDDDCIVHNIPELYEAFLASPDRIAHGLKHPHLFANAENCFGKAQMSLVGWGAFFQKEWVNVFDAYKEKYGVDELLVRKADRIFSLLLNRRHQSSLADVTDLDGASGEEALSVREDHMDLSEQAVIRALSLLENSSSKHSQESKVGDKTIPTLSQNSSKQDRPYFEFPRPEVVALIPSTAQSILDLGCGTGRLGESLKQRQSAQVTGVELDPLAAQDARNRLDRVVQHDIETLSNEFSEAEFDCVVCADVLEHLKSPDQTLKQIAHWLTPDGTIVASIPNVRNQSVLAGLIEGNWTYERAGLLDQTHYRFFTRREIEKLFFRAGYQIDQLQIVPGPGYQQWQEQGYPGKVQIGSLHIDGLPPEEVEEFYAYQYLITATKRPQPDYGLTSIIIVTHNQLPYTQQCIDSLRMRTDEPYELILVDNGSTDGTPDYFNSLADADVILNSENLGFPAAVNQGIAAASGDNILLLNNDTLMTTGWLHRLLARLHSSEDIGIVGPVSNNISGPQQIPVTYTDLASLDGFAWDLGKRHDQQSLDESRLVGFCMLFKRTLVDKIGTLDERFGIGCFEDDDFCRRANAAGYRTVIAADSFVHHFGSRSFIGSNADFTGIMQENEQKYREKWQTPVEQKELSQDTMETDKVDYPHTLSLCMIVRDNEDTIGPCLESIKPWVDEIIIVDTGSKDRTPDICREYGARMFEFPWCDDFSAARNESIKHALGKWIFWMDSDDTITEECGRKLKELAAQDHPDHLLGFIMQVHCPGPEGDVSMTAVDHVKLFRNYPDLRFEHRIHEQIIPAIRRRGGDVSWTDLYVVHSGSDHSVEGRKRKLERDYRLLELDNTERPNHPFVLFNLGMTYADDEKYPEAIKYLKQCLDVSHPSESQVRKAYALLVNALSQNEQHLEAWDYCCQGLTHFPGDKELLFRQAMLHHHFGRLIDAEKTYLRVLNEQTDRHFTSIDVGLCGYKTRHNLAVVYDDMGKHEQAEEQWRLIIKEIPNYTTAWKCLGETLLKARKLEQVEQLTMTMCGQVETHIDGFILSARLLEQQGDPNQAIELLEKKLTQKPQELGLLRELCRLHFEQSTLEDSLNVLHKLAEQDPGDASAFHNLGTAYLQLNQFEEAVTNYRKSLEIRPNSAETWNLLGHVYHNQGDILNAKNAWQETLRIFPGHKEASQQLNFM